MGGSGGSLGREGELAGARGEHGVGASRRGRFPTKAALGQQCHEGGCLESGRGEEA